ncbi:unnamed protein product [Effrenium voratum]|nr:unnamed protein product [Effrenium voratum]
MFAFDFDALELASAGPKKEAKVSPRETKCSETQRPGCDSAPALPSPAKGGCERARSCGAIVAGCTRQARDKEGVPFCFCLGLVTRSQHRLIWADHFRFHGEREGTE